MIFMANGWLKDHEQVGETLKEVYICCRRLQYVENDKLWRTLLLLLLLLLNEHLYSALSLKISNVLICVANCVLASIKFLNDPRTGENFRSGGKVDQSWK